LDELVTHPSPDKFTSPEKLSLKKTNEIDLEPDTISKINLEPVADIAA
jgi:hypothetical protein